MPVQRSTDNETGTPLEEFVSYFEYWPLRERCPGLSVCIYCGEPFTIHNPCWNSDIAYPDGSHYWGQCLACAKQSGKFSATEPVLNTSER